MHTINNLFFLLFQPHKIKFKNKKRGSANKFSLLSLFPSPPLRLLGKGKAKEGRERKGSRKGK